MQIKGAIVFVIFIFSLFSKQVKSMPEIQSDKELFIRTVNLRCEYLKDPLGIDDLSPRLSWNLVSEKRNQVQLAYQVLAASSEKNINASIGDLWDTGKLESDQNIHIRYAGKKLKSRMQIYWKVRVWDQAGNRSKWSEIAKWEMSMLDPVEWIAKWIGESEDTNPDSPETGAAPYFRKEFELKKEIKSARAYVSGLGYYELYLNGKKVGDQVLAPSQTNYDKRNLRELLYPYDDQSGTRVFYNTFDITDHLMRDRNTTGMILGNGWYNQRDRRAEGWMWYDTPRFILQIEIDYENGERKLITSDDSWKVSTGPIIHNGIFSGEYYDARREIEGWNRSGFDQSQWKKAQLVRSPTGKLESQLAAADKVIKTIRPIALSSPSEGVYLFDLGQMISGWVRLKIHGNRGDEVTLRYIEELGNDYRQKDKYILKGDGIEVFEPRFTWHAFREVEVSGVSVPLTIDAIEGRVVNTAVDTVGYFNCSNTLFNKIYQNYLWTQLGNFHGNLSSDCPHRERLGYTGDGQILVEPSIFNFDMTQFYRKWINDMDDARNKVTGFVPHTAPFGGGGGGPAWGSAYVSVPWFYYIYYGDTDILRQHYTGMKQWITYLGTHTDKDGIVVREEPDGWCLGDWATPGNIEIPPALVNTCYYYYITTIMSDVANILGYPQDSHYFSELADTIKSAVNKKYYNKNEKRYWTSRQGADVFPLAFGMVPENQTSGVLESMIKNILKNKGHLDTGILATPLMLEVLTQYNREDIAYTVMDQRDYPGYGDYIIGKGATTLWENWNGGHSHSHPMYGSVIRWFYKALAGINPDPLNPGFKHIIIKPTICGDLTSAKAGFESLYGHISSQWYLDNDDLHLKIEIPANTTATLYLPARDITGVQESGKTPKKENGIAFIKMDNGRAVYKIGSGKYEFVSKNILKLVKPVHVSTPQITPANTLFLNPEKAVISIQSATDGADIYYTVDGTEPSQNSIKYAGSFPLFDNTIVKARAFKEGYYPGFTKAEMIRFVDPELNGIAFSVYEGQWQDKPDLQNLNQVSTGRTFQFNVGDIKKREDHIAIIFESLIEIDQDGNYTFYSSANDGSVLYIDDKPVVDNAGYSGKRVDQGVIDLKKGRHFIKVLYYENTGTESINVMIEGPGLKKQYIPSNKLFLKK